MVLDGDGSVKGGTGWYLIQGHGRPEFSKCGRKTYMVAQEGQIGYTWGRHYTRKSFIILFRPRPG